MDSKKSIWEKIYFKRILDTTLLKKLCVLLYFILFLSNQTMAADISDYSILGFSEDGRYVAFEFSGVADGSGFPFIQITVFDCKNHELAEEPFFNIIHITEDEDYEKGAALAWDASTDDLENILQKYNISPADKGLPAIKKMEFAPPLVSVGFDFDGKYVIVELEEIEGIETKYDMCTPSGICFTSYVDKEETVIMNEKPATDIAHYKFDFSIEEVVLYKNTFTVIISYHEPGFEGNNTRQMIIGDIIKY